VSADTDTDKDKEKQDGEEPKSGFNYPATRKTLIQKLKDWDDQASWDECFRT